MDGFREKRKQKAKKRLSKNSNLEEQNYAKILEDKYESQFMIIDQEHKEIECEDIKGSSLLSEADSGESLPHIQICSPSNMQNHSSTQGIISNQVTSVPHQQPVMMMLDSRICRDYIRGVCKRGSFCRYTHQIAAVVSKSQGSSSQICVNATFTSADNIICRDYQSGVCSRGSSCRYQHIIPECPPNGKDEEATLMMVMMPTSTISQSSLETPNHSATSTSINHNNTCQKVFSSNMVSYTAPNAPAPSNFDSITAYFNPAAPPSPSISNVTSVLGDNVIPVCRDYMKGKCERGFRCRFRHITMADYNATLSSSSTSSSTPDPQLNGPLAGSKAPTVNSFNVGGAAYICRNNLSSPTTTPQQQLYHSFPPANNNHQFLNSCDESSGGMGMAAAKVVDYVFPPPPINQYFSSLEEIQQHGTGMALTGGGTPSIFRSQPFPHQHQSGISRCRSLTTAAAAASIYSAGGRPAAIAVSYDHRPTTTYFVEQSSPDELQLLPLLSSKRRLLHQTSSALPLPGTGCVVSIVDMDSFNNSLSVANSFVAPPQAQQIVPNLVFNAQNNFPTVKDNVNESDDLHNLNGKKNKFSGDEMTPAVAAALNSTTSNQDNNNNYLRQQHHLQNHPSSKKHQQQKTTAALNFSSTGGCSSTPPLSSNTCSVVSHSEKALLEENESLKQRLDTLKKQIAELNATVDMLLEQNRRLRLCGMGGGILPTAATNNSSLPAVGTHGGGSSSCTTTILNHPLLTNATSLHLAHHQPISPAVAPLTLLTADPAPQPLVTPHSTILITPPPHSFHHTAQLNHPNPFSYNSFAVVSGGTSINGPSHLSGNIQVVPCINQSPHTFFHHQSQTTLNHNLSPITFAAVTSTANNESTQQQNNNHHQNLVDNSNNSYNNNNNNNQANSYSIHHQAQVPQQHYQITHIQAAAMDSSTIIPVSISPHPAIPTIYQLNPMPPPSHISYQGTNHQNYQLVKNEEFLSADFKGNSNVSCGGGGRGEFGLCDNAQTTNNSTRSPPKLISSSPPRPQNTPSCTINNRDNPTSGGITPLPP